MWWFSSGRLAFLQLWVILGVVVMPERQRHVDQSWNNATDTMHATLQLLAIQKIQMGPQSRAFRHGYSVPLPWASNNWERKVPSTVQWLIIIMDYINVCTWHNAGLPNIASFLLMTWFVFLAQLAVLIRYNWSEAICLSVCLSVNPGSTNHYCCMHRLVIQHGNLDTHPDNSSRHYSWKIHPHKISPNPWGIR